MKETIQNIKGTKDILPKESYLWLYIENYIHNHFSKFGYQEIRTPSFEKTDLFLRSIGQETDIVSKEMYSWIDQGNNKLTLRPELTASVVRSYIQHQMGKQNKLHKLYYLGSSYRRERPQKGRFRQFKQFGLEAFGSSLPEQDAEIIYMAYSLYKSLQIKNLRLKINSIGNRNSRKQYKIELQKYFTKFKNELTEASQKRLKINPLRILDTKVDFEVELVKNAPKIIDYLDLDDQKHLESVLYFLKDMNVPYILDPYLVRGLDYYSRTVFEIQTNTLGAQSALCGGGRYDYLVKDLGGQDTPAIGFAAGLERLIMALDMDIGNKNPDIYIVSIGDSALSYSFNLANSLREKDLIVLTETIGRSLKSQMKDANRLNASHVIIIGDDEIKSQMASVKNMTTGHQEDVSLSKIIDYF
ncbi:MAG: histidine--tRNA ligase [Candidatus Marinimicrobia bacterium]|nr:histidine--tRNA ligase [Candidatus Neomarinimicrobiota bacterium]|tara:strand:+ start:10237 stop:11478 length:1242 start_codon:yes stop_codon:yes gene_type:complete